MLCVNVWVSSTLLCPGPSRCRSPTTASPHVCSREKCDVIRPSKRSGAGSPGPCPRASTDRGCSYPSSDTHRSRSPTNTGEVGCGGFISKTKACAFANRRVNPHSGMSIPQPAPRAKHTTCDRVVQWMFSCARRSGCGPHKSRAGSFILELVVHRDTQQYYLHDREITILQAVPSCSGQGGSEGLLAAEKC